MEVLDLPIITVPLKLIFLLLLIQAIMSTVKSASLDLANNKGFKGIIDEVALLAIEIGLIVVLFMLPLSAWLGPVISLIGYAWGIVANFLKSLPGILGK